MKAIREFFGLGGSILIDIATGDIVDENGNVICKKEDKVKQ